MMKENVCVQLVDRRSSHMLNGDMVSLYCYSLNYQNAILNLVIVGPLILIDENGSTITK